MNLCRTLGLATVSVLVGMGIGRAEPDVPPPSPTAPPMESRAMLSHSQRFLAFGPRPNELISVLLWVEDFADRLARFTRRALPSERGAPMRLVLQDDPQTPDSRVEILQAEETGGWTQRVLIVNPTHADPQEVLDAIAFLLLSRYPQALQSGVARRRRPAFVSPWWSDGIARQVLPRLRAQTRSDVRAAWESGRCLSLDRLLTPRPLAPGGGEEKAYASAAVDWVRDRRDFDGIFDGLTQRWAAGEMDDAAFLATRIAPSAPWREMEIEWELWIASFRGRQDEFRPATPADVRALREALTLRQGEAPDEWPDGLPESVPLDMLIERRREPWAVAAARRLAGAADRLRYGRDAEMRGVIDRFVSFFREIERSGTHPASWPWARWWEHHRLELRLAAARRALAALELKSTLRREETGEPDSEDSMPPFSAQEIERRALLEIHHDAMGTTAPKGPSSRPPGPQR